ncbi:Crp/Fnr family transcriptional regulator [Iamia sp.]|uniref:Crp/Fnr family transcriptional regulator n=1 Tax=Iamia sp. TaxID=2722710 RepID=UPI002BCB581D|nr:Crp/Fnr family transcriptional regulator [Iamia sp.]HXH57282.1 Crp/Fnr family transcriptional regulator [Iamia sp.]
MAETSLLRGVPLLADLSDEEMTQVEGATTTTDLLRGDLLFAEEQAPTDLHVVVSGRIAISKRSIDGRESMVALMERGDLFGDMGLFDGLSRSAEARALEASQVLTIPYAPLRVIYEARPDLLWSVVRLLAERLRNTNTALADSVFLDVTGRTAKRLLELAGDEDEFLLPITQEELAGMVGASRERVNKAIASFVRLGWIDQRERRYRILNRVELERRAR